MPDETTAPPPVDDGNVGVTIDGRQMRVPKGTLVVDAATLAGIHIPIYCAHPKMEPVAVCRMCLVTVEKMPKLQPACATVTAEGMVVTTTSPLVDKTREGMLEFLLVNHPLDCPVCDRGGECDLQDFAFRYGPGSSRFPITDKVHAQKGVVLSDKIELDQERCILCWRCTRYYDEITGEKELVLQQRGVNTVIDSFNGEPLTSEFQGNLPEVCPVGALTHRQYRFKARPWDLQRTKSVCPECSYGCNINVDTRDFDIKRFTSRDNPLVDDMWLCDRGRYSAQSWNEVPRVRRARLQPRSGQPVDASLDEAISAAASQLKGIIAEHGAGAVGVIGSAGSTNEELWLLQRLARDVIGTANLDHQLLPMDGLSPQEHELGIAEIEECDCLVVLGPEPERNAPVLTLRLHKAQRKHSATVSRLDAAPSTATIAAVTGHTRVGLIADETNRERAALVAVDLARTNTEVRRLTVTREVNGRGAKDMGVLPSMAPGYRPAPHSGKGGQEILDSVANHTIRALLLLDAQSVLASAGDELVATLHAADVVIALESTGGAVADAATVLIPSHSYMEKQGTVTNLEGRVQRIRAALPPSTAMPQATRTLTLLAVALGADWKSGDPLAVNRELCAAIPEYAAAGNGGRATWKQGARV